MCAMMPILRVLSKGTVLGIALHREKKEADQPPPFYEYLYKSTIGNEQRRGSPPPFDGCLLFSLLRCLDYSPRPTIRPPAFLPSTSRCDRAPPESASACSTRYAAAV